MLNITALISDYQNDLLTWHDIQDIVEAHVMTLDHKGMTIDPKVIHKRMIKSSNILKSIEKRLSKGGE